MEQLPTRMSEKGVPFTVADFYRKGRETLSLTLVAGGENMNRTIAEPIVNRPGLALTGFYEHFAWERLQIFGNAEIAYLDSLDETTRKRRVQALFDRKAFCFIYTCGRKPPADEVAFAAKFGAVLMSTPMTTSAFMQKCAYVLGKLGAPQTSLYGTMVEVCGLGVLFEGDPGLGKSETALGLIKRGCALVADDLTCIRKDEVNNILYGSASDSTRGFMEIRGIGIIDVERVFGVAAMRGEKHLELIVSFKRLDDVKGELDRVAQTRHVRRILGIDVPNIIIPISAGRDLVNLVETAAMQEKLIQSGYDSVEALSERLRLRADKMEMDKKDKADPDKKVGASLSKKDKGKGKKQWRKRQ